MSKFWDMCYLSLFVIIFDWLVHRLHSSIVWLDEISDITFILCNPNIAEWTLYEQVAVAAMDCQSIDVAKVKAYFHAISK